MESISDILKKKSFNSDKRNKYEFQAYGNRLAEELNDTAHRSLYIKLAKTEDRNLLETARLHVMGAEKIVEKGRLFMWKLNELKKLNNTPS
ncbi:hypothetical protein A2V49_01745 [candidate division WWE3 bacterium RBG_19FT_COMBO_34_6]|uniref:Uncharacterized protein n=1 Tax=candidate division WWE3 bacterium RBG_19FT_COMBO_34_6 TaxID=1802612 RepID=A0A1F4UK11_UNCKA|nr:MAG: hypothetical protein A2V49_01745 [candidate division WWE3 bacterium RBG_19FT_COMBO_34_6]